MENYGKRGGAKSLGKLMVEAGYSKESAKNPKIILESPEIKTKIEDFIKLMEDKRKTAIEQITSGKLEEAPARELAYVVDLLTKNIQLLSGGKTDNSGVQISWE